MRLSAPVGAGVRGALDRFPPKISQVGPSFEADCGCHVGWGITRCVRRKNGYHPLGKVIYTYLSDR